MMLGISHYIWHLLTKWHWLEPRIVGNDRYGFDLVDGCKKCPK